MNKELWKLRDELERISEQESRRLFRLAWRMTEHGCNPEAVERCRNEARQLHMNPYPERLLNPFTTWEYAFKIK